MFKESKKEWFSDWFDSKYYHLLYKNRNDQEAHVFLDNLLKFLKPSPQAHFLDLACGKGRHSIYINSLGFKVTGLDLSENSIAFAARSKNELLQFFVQDMREHFGYAEYDFVLNLFTSFGYFENEKENERVLFNVYEAMKPGGIFVMDFMNAQKVKEKLVEFEEKIINGITFTIRRCIKDSFIMKKIKVTDRDRKYTFSEKVQYLTCDKIIGMLINTGFEIKSTFGSYLLQSFNEQNSDRLVIIAQK